jgi:hypothetical protein
MREWGFNIRKHFPPDPKDSLLNAYKTPYDYMAFVLRFNTCMELFGCVCAFFLTRHWALRAGGGKRRYPFDGTWQGFAAALTLWLSPDMILSAHAWVTWDTWVVPWFLCTALLASLDWWFVAGLAMGIGTMFKGQQLFIASIFIIWPLLHGKYGAALRWIIGLVFSVAIITSGWSLTYIPPDKLEAAREIQNTLSVPQYPPNLFVLPRVLDLPATVWIAEMLLIAGAAPWLLKTLLTEVAPPQSTRWKTILYSRRTWIIVAFLAIFASAYWPFLLKNNREYWWLGLAGGSALAACALFLRPQLRLLTLAATAGSSLLLCMVLFHGSDGWFKSTFEYGLDHWPYMTQGPASNVPAVFEERFGWAHEADQIAFTLPAIQRHWPAFLINHAWWPAVDLEVSAKLLFNSIFIFFLLISALSVGLQARRKDRRMLVALVTPWLLFFLLPVQIHERYLVFAAGAAVCCIGADVGLFFLWLFLSLCSSIMLMNVLFRNSPNRIDDFGQNLASAFPRIFSSESGQTISQYVAGTHPDMAYGLVVVAMIFLYLSFTRSSQPKR